MNEKELTHLDLFSGIGGFALAAKWAGFRTIGFCEIDKYCQKVLRKHWPDVDIHSDIRSYKGQQCDLLTGGFPCQPFSSAGKRRGKEDDRHLWPEMLRVINEARPAFVVGENVVGIINMELDSVLSDLESIGYATRTFVVPACAVDARHRRNRVWIVAYDQRRRLAHGGAESVHCYARKDCQATGWSWRTEPDLGRVAHGIPNRVDRLKGLGNAIVPQVACQILKAIYAIATTL